VKLTNISKLSDYTSPILYSLDAGLTWELVSPFNSFGLASSSPVLWLKDRPLLQLRPAADLQEPVTITLGKELVFLFSVARWRKLTVG
jgi:hypothetical protein